MHGAVKSCCGEIIVESELHKGTRFTIYIPVTQLTTGKETILTEELTTGKENILIVDDETSICEIYKHALEGVGYHTTCCFSSLDALEIFKDKSDVFDLVITDMTMPHMTGDKLAQRLIEIKKDLPVIITSGYTGKLTQERLDKIGTKGFLMKPVSIYKVSETIRNLLDD